MSRLQRIVRVRREYNQWVANQTLEDYSLRFTAKRARKWSAGRVANTALGAISFLALEAIGGTITLAYGFDNAVAAILAVGALIFATSLPIAYYAARYGVDIDLLTRGAGFGYIGSTVTSLIYASFTFIFFAIEAVILASVLEICFGLPPWLGYIVCSLAVIPLVTHGITFISGFQRWSQPVWVILQLLPFPFILAAGTASLGDWAAFPGVSGANTGFALLPFAAAAAVVFSLIAQIGEQVDFLRFLPVVKPDANMRQHLRWWVALLAAGPGWIVIGVAKLLIGSYLTVLALRAGLPEVDAAQPTSMYRVAFSYVVASPAAALALTVAFVAVCQVKINVTNAYAGSIAWSNFFSRLTHSHPGRVVWLVFNVAIALLLMEIGIYQSIEHILSLYAHVAAAWVGALVADLVVNKPLGLSPRHIEFRRAHLYDVNPVGVGAVLLALGGAFTAYWGVFGVVAAALTPFLAFALAFLSAPVIAAATRGRYYLARKPRRHWAWESTLQCCICEHDFEPEDMAFCPAYSGSICSLCCSLDARCHDSCKPRPRVAERLFAGLRKRLPTPLAPVLNVEVWHFVGVLGLFVTLLGVVLTAIYLQTVYDLPHDRAEITSAFWKTFAILVPFAGVAAWLLVLARRSWRVAAEESRRQTGLLMREIRAHERTDAALQKAKEAAEAANLAKSRYIAGLNHELRSPLNAILGYAQLMERDNATPGRWRDAVRLIRRSGDHLAGMIEGLLDIARIEAGRIEIYRDHIRFPDFLAQLVDMFRLQAEAKGISFAFSCPDVLPETVFTDEKRLRQILINLLSNAVKFTNTGTVRFGVRWRSPIVEFEVEDTGPGIAPEDQERIFEPFERAAAPGTAGVGLGLTITRLFTQILGGEITLVSTPGKGSLFRVRLMLSESAQTEQAVVLPVPLGYLGERRSIVVCDDDPVHRDLMRDVLSPLGFTVLGAADGAACLALARKAPPDLFLLDISMPGMDGWDLAARLRAEGNHKARIVMVSANAGQISTSPKEARAHDAVLAKPVSLSALLELIGRLLNLEYLPTPATAPISPVPALPPGALAARSIADLRHLAAIGYVSGIKSRLDELAEEQPDLEPQLSQLRDLVGEFRLPEFLAALDAADAHVA